MTMYEKTKEQLINELTELHQQIAGLESVETQRKQVEALFQESLEQIERAKQEWEVTADSLPQLICLLDKEAQIIRTNRLIERWGSAAVIKVKGKKIWELLYPEQSENYLQAFLQEAWPDLAQGKSAECEVDDQLLKRHLLIQLQPISTQTGQRSQVSDSFAVLIIHDITERKQAERLKNEFLANITQELQTPLTSIIGYSQMMLTNTAHDLPPAILEDIHAIHENGQHLVTLINEILDLAEIETHNLKLVQENIAVKPLLEQIKTNHKTLLRKPIDIEVEVEPDLPPLKADKVRLNQILNHLVSNAVKFTAEGQINLRTFRQNGWLCFEVADTGIGIAESDLEIIFDKFRQVDGSLARRGQGVGLGLTITRYLVQLHGGTIEVDSQVDQGTTITVRLPFAD